MNYRIILALCTLTLQAQTREHTEASIVIHLKATPAVTLPLFGPVREAEWSPHWKPRFIFPESGAQAAGAVFTTGKPTSESVWVMTAYDQAGLHASYVVIEPGMTVTELDIALKPEPGGTQATVAYRWTSLSASGDTYVARRAQEFPAERDHWEHAINARLMKIGK